MVNETAGQKKEKCILGMLTWCNYLVNNKSANMTIRGAKRKQHEYN